MIPDPLPHISSAINEALNTDAANREYLQSLGNVRIGVSSESPEVAIVIHILDGQVSLSKHEKLSSEDCDIRISGTAINLAKLLLQPVESAAQLRHAKVRVEGEVALMLELTQLSKKVEIDWEALLAERIGDTPAVLIGRGVKNAKEMSENLIKSQQSALARWLQSAESPVIMQDEHEQMKERLRELHYQLDRLEVRLNQTPDKTQAADR